MSWRTDENINEVFADLKERATFRKSVLELRKKAKIPAGGFKVEELSNGKENYFFDWREHLPKKSISGVDSGVNILIKKFRLLPIFKDMIRAYLIFGEHMPKELLEFNSIEQTIGCSLDQDQLSFMLRIYPGATQTRVVTFLKKNWHEIENYYMANSPDKFGMRVKKKPNRERDKLIIKLYDMGIISARGNLIHDEARIYLKSKSIPTTDKADISLAFKKHVVELPSPDATRKVIERQNKTRKS